MRRKREISRANGVCTVMNQVKIVCVTQLWYAAMHRRSDLWISVWCSKRKSKPKHVFLLVWIAALVDNQSQSQRANTSVWKLALIWHPRTFLVEQMLCGELLHKSACEERHVTWMGGQRNMFSPATLFLGPVRCVADWSGIVFFVKAWPSEVRSCAVNLGQERKSRRLESWRKAWESSGEQVNEERCRAVCRHSFVITHLWRKRPDILSAHLSKAPDSCPDHLARRARFTSWRTLNQTSFGFQLCGRWKLRSHTITSERRSKCPLK